MCSALQQWPAVCSSVRSAMVQLVVYSCLMHSAAMTAICVCVCVCACVRV